MKTLFQILLVAASLVLLFLCYRSIQGPIEFDEAKTARDKAVIARLIDIRKAQVEYRNKYGRYTASFDTLINFVKTAKLPFVIKEGQLTDVQLEAGLTEKEAVKKGLIKRDTFYVSLIDTLYGKNFMPDSMRYIPGIGKQFTMATGSITTTSGLVVQLFEAKCTFKEYLEGLDKQSIINLKEEAIKLNRFPGLQIGSIEEPNNNAGNWE